MRISPSILIVLLIAFAISVSGQTSIEHRTTSTTISGFRSAIDHPQLNGNADAIVLAEAPSGYPHAVAVWYIANKWHVFNVDQASMSAGTNFSIRFWSRPDQSRFAHVVTTRNLSDGRTTIDHPQLNGNATASLSVTQSMSNARGGYWNANEAKAEYDERSQRWYLANTNGQPILAGNAYNIVIADAGQPVNTQILIPGRPAGSPTAPFRPPATGTPIAGGPINYQTTPEPLRFSATLGRKIILYPGQTGDVGLSVQGNLLQIHSDKPDADVAIGYDQGGTFKERFRVKGNGAIAVNGDAGQPGQVLMSNGPNAPPVWRSDTRPVFAFGNQLGGSSGGSLLKGQSRKIDTMTLKLALAKKSVVSLSFLLSLQPSGCIPLAVGCGGMQAISVHMHINGQFINPSFIVRATRGSSEAFLPVNDYMFELPAGNHTIDFTATNVITEEALGVSAYYSSAVAYPIE